MSTEVRSRAPLLLTLGATLGLLMAVWGIVRAGPEFNGSIPTGAAAVVAGSLIERDAFERAVELLAADSKNPIGEEERRHVLDRLIEEELLVQRARELGIDEHDKRVRSLLVSSMIDSIVADAQPEEPRQSEVEEFFVENSGYFARTGRIHVRALRFAARKGETDEEARERARQARSRLQAGESSKAVEAELADPSIVPVPGGLLPPAKLREYLGPTATNAALGLEQGDIGEPIKAGRNWYVLEIIDREPGRTPPLEEVESEVRAEMFRRAGDNALRQYLENLRDRADVWVRPGVTQVAGKP